MRIAHVIHLGLLLCVVAGCSRSQKSGKSITTQDITEAMPEFPLAATPGAVNVFLERKNPTALMEAVRFKMTVPRASVSNFLWGSGFQVEFLPIAAGTLPAHNFPLPKEFDAASAVSWAADVNSAAEWDFKRRKTPLRMAAVETPALGAPSDRVILMIFVDDSNSDEAPIYFQYYRLSKKILKR